MAIPREFSKTKEEINEAINDHEKAGGEESKEDSGEALLEAMKCTNCAGYRHRIPLDDLVSQELGQTDTATALAFQEQGLDANSQRCIDGIGKNALTPPTPRHPCLVFLDHQTGFFSLLLWFGGVLCFIGWGLDKSAPDNLYLGIVLFVVVFLTGVFSYMQEAASAKTMEGFADMLPQEVNVTRNGKTARIPAADLVVGDVVTVNMGDKIPADIRMLQVTNLKIEQSSLTGEPDAISKSADKDHENPLESQNLAFFGTMVQAGSGVGVVVLVGDNTIMGNIANLAAGGETRETPIEKEIHRFILIVSSVAIALGVTFVIVSGIKTQDAITSLVFMIGIIVANVPEGLLATVTVSLTLTAKKLKTKAVNVKDLNGVETLGSTTCICSDKTGTLTQNRMTANHVYVELNDPTNPKTHTYEVKGLTIEIPVNPNPPFDLADPAIEKLTWCCNLVNGGEFDAKPANLGLSIQQRECLNGNASDYAFVKFAEGVFWKREGKKPDHQAILHAEQRAKMPVVEADIGNGRTQKIIIPFNSKYKFMVSLHWVVDEKGNKRPAVLMKGAAEQIFQRCGNYVRGSQVLPIDATKIDNFVNVYNEFGKQGERVIGFCMKYLDEVEGFTNEGGVLKMNGELLNLEGDPDTANYPIGTNQFNAYPGPIMSKPDVPPPAWDAMDFVGLISLIDPPREAVPKSVLLCRKAGVKVVMVTGDHPLTARAIARKVNIIQDTAFTVDEWMEMNGVDDEQAALEANKIRPDHPDLQLEVNRHKRYTLSHIEAKVIPGWVLKDMTPDEVKEAFMYRDLVFARTSPEQKLKIVNAAQEMGHVVAVTGDGVNDSPALKGADIGCAMGIAGTEVSKEAADMILMTDDFSAIVLGIEEGRLIFDNLKKSIAYTLSSNIPEISPFLMYIILDMPLSLTTVLILCVDLGTDMVPAISLAYETAESDIMERPPRDSKEDHLVTVKLISFAYLQIGVFQALAGFYSFFVVMNDYGFQMKSIAWNSSNKFNEYPEDKSGKSICPCGKGTKKLGSKYAAKIVGGTLDTTDSKYSEIPSSELTRCPDSEIGSNKLGSWVTSVQSDYGDDDYENNPFNWPYTWGCKFGSFQPGKECKYPNEEFQSYNPCYKASEALGHAQTAAFISIVIVQWADLIICKTRKLSIYHQGMSNQIMMLGLCTETLLCMALAYLPPLHAGIGTRDVIAVHWFPSFPFSIAIFLYDETRKYLIRRDRRIDPSQPGWLEKFTYY